MEAKKNRFLPFIFFILSLVKIVADKFQRVNDARAPVLPIMNSVANTEFMRHFFFGEHNMNIAISFDQEIVIATIDPVFNFFQVIC